MPSLADIRAGVPILTQRLKLRRYQPSDLPVLAVMNGDPEIMQYLGRPLTAAQSDDLAATINERLATRGYGMAAVERRADGAFIGMCGFSPEVWYPDDLELGWRLGRTFWGEGYATEAGTAWLAFAFEAHGVDRVISIADAPNARSIAVMKRLGFKLDHSAELDDDGETFSAVIYAISRGAWRSQTG